MNGRFIWAAALTAAIGGASSGETLSLATSCTYRLAAVGPRSCSGN